MNRLLERCSLIRQIYNLESSYLEDTYNVGTALKVARLGALLSRFNPVARAGTRLLADYPARVLSLRAGSCEMKTESFRYLLLRQ